jgi:hypothetical protein
VAVAAVGVLLVNRRLMAVLAAAVQAVQRRLEEQEIRHLSVQAKGIVVELEMEVFQI